MFIIEETTQIIYKEENNNLKRKDLKKIKQFYKVGT